MKKILHQELIPQDHRCNNCGRNKEEVQFKVSRYADNRRVPYLDKLCTTCLHRKDSPLKSNYRIAKRKEIKESFDRYFKERV